MIAGGLDIGRRLCGGKTNLSRQKCAPVRFVNEVSDMLGRRDGE